MTSDHNIPDHTNTNRKRAAANNEVPPPKRHHPDAVDQLLETIKFQQQQINKATDIWVRLKGGEDKLGDANTIFLGLVKSAMYSGSLAVKLVENQEDDVAEHEGHLDKRFSDLETSLREEQNSRLQIIEYDIAADIEYEANEAVEDILFGERLAAAISNAVAQDPDVVCDEELMEMKKFVRAQMKLAKDAPETSQDVLREHEVEIGL
ncbi:hypothetical protein M436DRAFT_84979 [Aureobasidium namibiae CBS 147.97]|uniref:Uncharacterized protein n=1 Tax=Aureobasidium namibiae CBS 147.97 TaxID=1043004 RepID=A0A074WAG7_9PEZI